MVKTTMAGITTTLKALGEPFRLTCLLLLQQEGELCVCELMEALDVLQPKVSRHLLVLKQAGLVLDRRQGQWIYYKLNPDVPDFVRASLMFAQAEHFVDLATASQRLANMANRPYPPACCN